ncbi:hypothetical protein SAMN02745135_01773 [Caloranaerobacter azorensis DSM 13643]|uniref:DUF5673 domain-containing protein n=1 Tax=Caloranaerobacter azorensis DSM 13643 TaxID=1121264 RepID=A0A1M5V6Y5_9FIRM|nr:DUF5673 domain-containing protein [Caloranaerobacter azorensis]SHH70844.1 hypothetical protein SAMN02745135_01773 [Caloranaerobacter azorensis DSM 13643]
MKIFITFNLLIFVFFIFYLGYISVQILKYKRNKLNDSDIVIVVNEPKESTYIEKLTNRFFIIAGCIFAVFVIIEFFIISTGKTISYLYLVILYINFWYIQYNKKLGFIMTQNGLMIGFQFIEWDKIREYKWIERYNKKNKITLKIKKHKSLFEIPIDVNVHDKDRIEEVFKEYLVAD